MKSDRSLELRNLKLSETLYGGNGYKNLYYKKTNFKYTFVSIIKF